MGQLKAPLSILILSDVHLGHRKTPTNHIISNLIKCVNASLKEEDIELIIISGDLFDRFLNLPGDDAYEIHSWMAWLLRLCKRRNIVLRVLEGTPSHDWKQSRYFDSLNTEAGIEADAKFVGALSIEHIERFGIDVLYIPDEWNADNDDTWLEVQEALAAKSLDQVDITVMHGQFSYQLPDHVNVPVHDPDRYASITKLYAFCGHVHKPSQYKNIIVPGSFDRLSHGEEERKGYWIVSVNPEGDDRIVFYENENSMKYVTIPVHGLDLESIFKLIEKRASTLPDASHIRLSADRSDVISGNLDVLKRMYVQYQWTSKINVDVSSQKDRILNMPERTEMVQITPKNIITTLEQYMTEKMAVEGDTVSDCLAYLKKVL